MKIFLSWSGDRSKAVAEELKNWLSMVIQALVPWISTDITKGSRWSPTIAKALEESKVGIVCLTPENLRAPWILFEAGALAKTTDALICTLLIGLEPSDVQQPLGQFQHTIFQEDEMFKLMENINSRLGETGGHPLEQEKLRKLFETFWPELERRIGAIPVPDGAPPRRELHDMVSEILLEVRKQRQLLQQENPRKYTISRRLSRLRKEIEEHNRRYYEEAQPVISDSEYDELVLELRHLEKMAGLK